MFCVFCRRLFYFSSLFPADSPTQPLCHRFEPSFYPLVKAPFFIWKFIYNCSSRLLFHIMQSTLPQSLILTSRKLYPPSLLASVIRISPVNCRPPSVGPHRPCFHTDILHVTARIRLPSQPSRQCQSLAAFDLFMYCLDASSTQSTASMPLCCAICSPCHPKQFSPQCLFATEHQHCLLMPHLLVSPLLSNISPTSLHVTNSALTIPSLPQPPTKSPILCQQL
jgi:hypothetical protein